MKTLIVIPTYNELTNLPTLIPKIHHVLPCADILIVDDASPDGSGKYVANCLLTDPQLHLLNRPQKAGLGRAYIAGFKWALAHAYDRIIQMDADFSHDPDDLPRLLEASNTADVVIGSRYVGGKVRVLNWPLHRLFLSIGASYYVRLFTRMPIADPTGGYKVFHREVLETLKLDHIATEGYAFQIEMNYLLWKQGRSVKEIPIVFADRTLGSSKMSLSIAIEAIFKVPCLIFRKY